MLAAAAAIAALSLAPSHASVSIGCAGEKVRVTVSTTGDVRFVDFVVNGRGVARDRSKPYTRLLRRAGGKQVAANVRFADGRTIRLGRRAPRC